MAEKKAPQAGGEENAPKRKMTRAERSAANKAAHAAKLAAEAAAKEPKPLEDAFVTLPAPDQPRPDAQTPPQGAQQDTEDSPAAPLDASHAQGAHTHTRAHAHEGAVLAPEEFAGLVDEPVPPETAATARYAGMPHKATAANEAAVMALRWAGQSDEEIALYLSCSIATLYGCYRVQLAEAHAKMAGKIAIRIAQDALTGRDFKVTRFVAEKRLRGFGRPDTGFVAVRPDAGVGPIDGSTNGRNAMGQSAAALAQRKKSAPEIGEDGVIEFGMVLGVAERPLKQNEDGTIAERTDGEIAADVAERGDA